MWMTSIEHQPATWYVAVVALFVAYWLPDETSYTGVSFVNFKRSLHLNAAMDLLGLKLDFSYPLSFKFRSLVRNKYTPMSTEFTWSKLNNPKYAHIKNHINPKRLSYKFWYWTKTAITFGEECISWWAHILVEIIDNLGMDIVVIMIQSCIYVTI